MKLNGYWKQEKMVASDLPRQINQVDKIGVSKLLAVSFGLSLSTHDVENFLFDNLSKKLTHWCATKINPMEKNVVANSVQLSSMFFFLSILGGSKKGVIRIKSSIMNYLDVGKVQKPRI